MEADFLGQGLHFPVDFDSQSSIKLAMGQTSVKQSIGLILSTEKGERLMRPSFGCDLNKLVFENNDIATRTRVQLAVEEALEEFEPRIELLNVEVLESNESLHRLDIRIEYRVLANNVQENIVYPFYLGEA